MDQTFEEWFEAESETLRPMTVVTPHGSITTPLWMDKRTFEQWLDSPAGQKAEALARRRSGHSREWNDQREAAIAERDRRDRISDRWPRPRPASHERQASHAKAYTSLSSREITESKRERVRESERAAGAGLRSRISSITCARSHFTSQAEAARWVRDHDFRADKAEDVSAGYVFRQRDLAPDAKGFRTIPLDPGVEGVVYEGER